MPLLPITRTALLTLSVWFLLPPSILQADQDRPIDAILIPQPVTEQIYYFYGSLENRTPANLGLNNNIGFVITTEGVVLIDSGPSRHVAERIEAAIATVTDRPVTHVVNLGSQDHRWLGNDHFLSQGAHVVALERTTTTQTQFAQQHLERLTRTLGEAVMADTVPRTAPSPAPTYHHRFSIGGIRFELVHAGDAHFPGDAVLHLPDRGVVFTGDVVYTERMLGIHPWSDPVGQLAAFETLATWSPEIIIPGHGAATDLATARRDTGDYLVLLNREVKQALEDWETLDDTVERLAELPAFRHLRHYDDWHRMNVNRTYLFLESRQ
ncbi:MBL fold metallo-hydrolase [Ectothiorhodospira lacustris]|uniref:MBL fold metallo-hydrolase n=1 Tax=Ectothiorhodospira lacustris TaxID=2899127 RepID=UPI001EE888F1|nr:MBL fold metallo-hydrolase [Ectothiorhodospira lacustris]MCG5499537.1 MBL fold metallo-hydrolase [Ectothiorhodospira lacustris]MCG5511115.1 MBL fold metallo-hydrolase [Ectothiorhodospira lacustris]MCG5522878.1 MBL fold metallo-hydrolase [Ectothiorhodospira lacustris]